MVLGAPVRFIPSVLYTSLQHFLWITYASVNFSGDGFKAELTSFKSLDANCVNLCRFSGRKLCEGEFFEVFMSTSTGRALRFELAPQRATGGSCGLERGRDQTCGIGSCGDRGDDDASEAVPQLKRRDHVRRFAVARANMRMHASFYEYKQTCMQTKHAQAHWDTNTPAHYRITALTHEHTSTLAQ
eukprot:3830266-Pleurochrysis_carterae.AAC.1